MELKPSGRLPGIRTDQDKLTMSLARNGDTVTIRCDSDQVGEFWLEATCEVKELLRELLSGEPT